MAEIVCCCDSASPVACAMCGLSAIRNPVKCYRIRQWPLVPLVPEDVILDDETRDLVREIFFGNDIPGEPGPGGKAQ